jgi:hypothetical protein
MSSCCFALAGKGKRAQATNRADVDIPWITKHVEAWNAEKSDKVEFKILDSAAPKDHRVEDVKLLLRSCGKGKKSASDEPVLAPAGDHALAAGFALEFAGARHRSSPAFRIDSERPVERGGRDKPAASERGRRALPGRRICPYGHLSASFGSRAAMGVPVPGTEAHRPFGSTLSVLLNEEGGILDDCMITRWGE